jgi:hypothetical protein
MLLGDVNATSFGGSFQLDTLGYEAAIPTSTPTSPGARALTALSSSSASMNASLSPANSPSINASLSPASSPMMGGFQSRLARQSGGSFRRESSSKADAFPFPDDVD